MNKTFSLLSDTHGNQKITVDPCDFLLLSGDICPLGIDTQPTLSEHWLNTTFNAWLEEQPAKHIIFIAGNHDFAFDRKPEHSHRINHIIDSLPENVHYLQDSEIIIDGIKFYGSPYTPWFWDWAFNLPKDDAIAAQACWGKIPSDTDVLLTHGPAAGILDANKTYEPCGCPDLLNRIGQLRGLKLHLFGHIHDSFGSKQVGNTLHVNAAYGYSHELENRPKTAPIVEIDFSK